MKKTKQTIFDFKFFDVNRSCVKKMLQVENLNENEKKKKKLLPIKNEN